MSADTAGRCYYLDRFSDEVLPCWPTLDGWAQWLSKPDQEWGRSKPADDGEGFAASVLRLEQDIIATRSANGWSFSRDPAGAALLAVRFGEGLGWGPDAILDGDDPAQELRDWLRDNDDDCEDVEYVAVGIAEPDVRVIYRAGPPPACVVEAVQ